MSLNIVSMFPTETSIVCNFDRRLNHRGTDFRLYANTGYQPHEADSLLLQQIIKGLFTDFSGVNHVNVTCYGLHVIHSAAVTNEKVINIIMAGTKRAGFDPSIKASRTCT